VSGPCERNRSGSEGVGLKVKAGEGKEGLVKREAKVVGLGAWVPLCQRSSRALIEEFPIS
jgi:hypothetical protein